VVDSWPLSAADGMHNFNLVARLYDMAVKHAAWHDFPVHFQGQSFARQAKGVQQFVGTQFVGKVLAVTVQDDVHVFSLQGNMMASYCTVNRASTAIFRRNSRS
jgi:hypothetical protein